MKKIVSCFLCFLLLLQTAKAEDPQEILLAAGEEKKITLGGDAPFLSDESFADIKELGQNVISITGKKIGNTQLLYWKDGTLASINLKVTPLDIFSSSTEGPKYINNKPYLLYSLQNSSSYNNDAVFDRPTFTHSLHSTVPNFWHGRLTSYATVNQLDTATPTLLDGQLNYADGRMQLNLGSTSVQLAQLVSFGDVQTQLFGGETRIRFRPQKSRKASWSKELSFFGGSEKVADLLQTDSDLQLYGANFKTARFRQDALFEDIGNATFFMYQRRNSKTFFPGGFLESTFHVGKNLSLGNGVGLEKDGLTTTFNPRYEYGQGLVFASYDFINEGFQGRTFTQANNSHEYHIDQQHLFKDKISHLSAGLGQNITTGSNAANNFFSSLKFDRRISYQKQYGTGYNLSRSSSAGNQTLTNSLSGFYRHPLNAHTSLSHNLAYSRTDLSSSSNTLNMNSSVDYERKKIALDASANVSLPLENPGNGGFSLQQALGYNVSKRLTVTAQSAYNKNSFNDALHNISFAPAMNWNLTSTTLLSGNSGFGYTFGEGRDLISGTIAFNLRRYLGPGVESDPIYRKFFKGGNEYGSLKGIIFIDNNYNGSVDAEDTLLPHLPVIVGEKNLKTDQKGEFALEKVKAGSVGVQADIESVAEQYQLEPVNKYSLFVRGNKENQIFIPLLRKAATLSLNTFVDVNNNGKVDEEDVPFAVQKAYLKGSGQDRTLSLLRGALVKGLQAGSYTVELDLFDLPEHLQLVGAYSRSVNTDGASSYKIDFLFTPLRQIYGAILSPDKKINFAALKIVLEDGKSYRLNSEGAYWMKDLPAGTYQLKIEGLPSGVCVRNPEALTIGLSAIGEIVQRDIALTTDCPAP